MSFSSPILSPSLLKPVSDPSTFDAGVQVNSSLLRQIFANPHSAAALEMARANKMDSFWPWVLAGISFPIMAGKQLLNVIQLVKACRWLGEGDVAARRAAGLPRNRPKKAKKTN